MMRRTLFLSITTLLLSACDAPNTHDPVEPAFDASSMMRYSCYDPEWHQCGSNPPLGDPAPGAAGVYLGQNFSWQECTSTGGLDQDGIDDFCEFQLALSFRPLLATSPSDQDLSREPYWAVNRIGNLVRIFYGFAYHWDNGTDAAICSGDYRGDCLSHAGDAEHMVVRILWNTGTEHWELHSAYFAAHAGSEADGSLDLIPPYIEFPGTYLHYPRAWVARDKHANYSKRTICNDGGFLSTDTCQDNVDDQRLEVWEERNLGSSAIQFVDYTTTMDDPFLYTGNEYFWDQDFYFCGWDGDSLNHNRANCSRNTAYGTLLRNHDF